MTQSEVNEVEYAAVGAREKEILEWMLKVADLPDFKTDPFNFFGWFAKTCGLVRDEGEFYEKYLDYHSKKGLTEFE